LEEIHIVCQDTMRNIPPEMITVLRAMPMLVIIEGQPEANHQRMVERDNQIDTKEPVEYILKQNIAFTYFAEAFNWPIISCHHAETPEQFIDRCQQRLRELYEIKIGPILRKMISDSRVRRQHEH